MVGTVGPTWFRLALCAIFASVAIAIVYVGVAKFDLNDPATNDVHQYIALYRGHSIDGIVKPFRYRLVVPELARLIPNPPATLLHGSDITSDKIVKLKFGLVNAAFLFVGAWSLLLLLTTFGFSEDEAALGSLLFLASYCVILGAGLPLVDVGAYGALAFCCLASARDWRIALALAVLVGMFVKETTVLVLPFALACPPDWRTRRIQVVACLPGVVLYGIVRLLLWPTSSGYTYSVGKTLSAIPKILEPRPVFEIVMTFGPLWILAAFGAYGAAAQLRGVRGLRVSARLLWFVAAVLAITLANGSNFGRSLFLAFPVVIPYALIGLRLLRRRATDEDRVGASAA